MLPRLAAIVVLSGAVASLHGTLGGAREHDAAAASAQGTLRLYRLSGGAVQPLEDGDAAAGGDRVQLAYDAGAHAYGVIFSVDDRAHVTLHFPRYADDSTLLDRPRGVLRSSFELDDARGAERFYFVTGERPLDVRRALRRRGRPLISLQKPADAPRARGVR